jgi:hypothetical protein
MRFDTWNIRKLHGRGLLMTVVKELSKYKLDSVGMQVRWDRGGTELAGAFLYGKGNEDHEICTRFFVRERNTSI